MSVPVWKPFLLQPESKSSERAGMGAMTFVALADSPVVGRRTAIQVGKPVDSVQLLNGRQW